MCHDTLFKTAFKCEQRKPTSSYRRVGKTLVKRILVDAGNVYR
jgi:hypothetical protein